MPHRELLTESQRLSLHAPASDERGMVRHHMLTSEDLALINRRRRDPNRLGYRYRGLAASGPDVEIPLGVLWLHQLLIVRERDSLIMAGFKCGLGAFCVAKR